MSGKDVSFIFRTVVYLVLGKSPDPAPSRCRDLGSTSTLVVVSDIAVKCGLCLVSSDTSVVRRKKAYRNLVRGVRNSVQKSRSEVLRSARVIAEVDLGRVGSSFLWGGTANGRPG